MLGAKKIRMISKAKIPSEEDFARAKQRMRQRSAKEAEFKSAILSKLPENQPCHDIWIWLSDDGCTVSYIFPTDSDLKKDETKEIVRAVETSAQNQRIEKVVIEYHSHEYVLKQYNGNYDKYFR